MPFINVLLFSDCMNCDVEHHTVDQVWWIDNNGDTKELRTYHKIAHKWRQIATQLGFELREINN